jgi:inhibitor of cysteine peptidase
VKIRRSHLLLVLVTTALALSMPTAAIAGMVTVTEADNGRELTLSRGDTLEVSLPATSGTGYTWQAVPIADPIARQVRDMKFRAADNQMPGASGHQVFRFSVEASGTGSLEFRYVRPWEKDTPPAKVFKILLIVK